MCINKLDCILRLSSNHRGLAVPAVELFRMNPPGVTSDADEHHLTRQQCTVKRQTVVNKWIPEEIRVRNITVKKNRTCTHCTTILLQSA